jgi:aminomethyltransferase
MAADRVEKNMPKKTALYDAHVQQGAKIVDFAGWDMPLHYGSQIAEHTQVREDAGMFDVSHMTVVDLNGTDCRSFLQRLLANNIDRLQQPGKALYSCMLNEQGGIIDDLITFYMADDHYRLVVNAATRDKDMAWFEKQAAAFDVQIKERPHVAMIAVQGPHARDKAHHALDEQTRNIAAALGPFFGAYSDTDQGQLFISRTGYTGEDGYEIILPQDQAPHLWQALLDAGIKPVGLGARDTLRLEAGMALYGTDMDESTSPLVSGLNWTVAWEPAERDFIGRPALEKERSAADIAQFVGLIMDDRGMLRNHQPLIDDAGQAIGEITSGSFSPVIGKAIALARVAAAVSDHCYIETRGKRQRLRVVKPPFVRNGKIRID